MSKKNKYEDFDDEFEYYDDDEIEIDWIGIFHKLYAKKWLILITLVVSIAVTIPLSRTAPDYYNVEVKLTPESSSGKSSGGWSGILSSFGISSGASGGEGIGPSLYPDLMNSKTFLVSLFDIPVVSKDRKIKTYYYDYLANYEKESFWNDPFRNFFNLITFHKQPKVQRQKINIGSLTPEQASVSNKIKQKVTCEIDNKTGIISISVTDQDPVICTTVAEATSKRLQQFITDYRSKKDLVDMQNIEKQYNQSVVDYDAAKARVEGFNNGNWDLVDQDLMVEQQDLQNKMQLEYQTMTTFKTQLIAARAKYQTSIPVFTVLDGASVPQSPAGPNREMIVTAIVVIVLFIEIALILFLGKIKETIIKIRKDESK